MNKYSIDCILNAQERLEKATIAYVKDDFADEIYEIEHTILDLQEALKKVREESK